MADKSLACTSVLLFSIAISQDIAGNDAVRPVTKKIMINRLNIVRVVAVVWLSFLGLLV